MTSTLRIDFISDVACPWCAVGLAALDKALARLAPDVQAEVHCQPFELNPTMAPEGADAAAYLKAKYGMNDAQLAQSRARILERGAAEGFVFGARHHVWNTFDAHRLLHWAGEVGAPGQQLRVKRALLAAYHSQGRNPGAREVLLDAAQEAGLNPAEAAQVIDSDRYTAEVRAAEQQWQALGIQSVPAVVINQRHLISGGQPSEVFEQALREIAAQDDGAQR
jgi:predicted DsbA family dithiol-disulfide isomerase